MNTDRKTIDGWYRSHGFNIPQEQEDIEIRPACPYCGRTSPDHDPEDCPNFPKIYSQYEILQIILKNRHKISPEALDCALCSLMDFNTDMFRALTFPKTINEVYNGYPIRIATEVC